MKRMIKKTSTLILISLFLLPSSNVFAETDSPNNDINEKTELSKALAAGYSEKDFNRIMDIPDIPQAISPRSAVSMNSEQTKVVNEAKKYLGVPYLWGGSTPAGFDCSGLVQYVFNKSVTISLPRVTTDQEKQGKSVSLNALLPGDLLFWGSIGSSYHVAIYIGNNQYIHSPSPGQVVKIQNISSWTPNFARRILKETPDLPLLPNGTSIVIKDGAYYYYDGSKITDADRKSAYIINGYETINEKYGSKRVYSVTSSSKKFYEADVSKQTSSYPYISMGSSVTIKSTSMYYYNGGTISQSDKESAFILEKVKDIPKQNGSIRAYKVVGSEKWFYEADISKQTSDYEYISLGSSISVNDNAYWYYNGGSITDEDKSKGFFIEKVKDIPKKYNSIRAYKVRGSDKWFYESDIQKQSSNYAYISMGTTVKIKSNATHFYDGSIIPDALKTSGYKLVGVQDIKKQSGSIRAYTLEGLEKRVLEQDIEKITN